MKSDTKSTKTRTAAVVGLKGIGKAHIKAIRATENLELTAVCDLDPEICGQFAQAENVRGCQTLEELLADVKPDVVAIGTPTSSHAGITIQLARAGAPAIMCEKPMAVHMADAVAMVEACESSGSLLVINHQRRMGIGAAVRERIAGGVIGDLVELRGFCAGDLLSDGTHVIDSLQALAGDPETVEAQGALDVSDMSLRYGHIKEAGAAVEWVSGDGLWFSAHCGSMAQRRAYQEYHIAGTRGSLWRCGDRLSPRWYILDGKPGTHETRFDRQMWFYHPVEAAAGGGPWRPLFDNEDFPAEIAENYRSLLASLDTDEPHPNSGRRTLATQEILNAGYYSAIQRKRVKLPLSLEDAGKFPLETLAGS